MALLSFSDFSLLHCSSYSNLQFSWLINPIALPSSLNRCGETRACTRVYWKRPRAQISPRPKWITLVTQSIRKGSSACLHRGPRFRVRVSGPSSIHVRRSKSLRMKPFCNKNRFRFSNAASSRSPKLNAMLSVVPSRNQYWATPIS